jgi:RES domain-containing protein
MQAWRIAKRRYALDRAGAAAAIKGGRWNSANVAAIYAGLTIEIAAFEKLVHAGAILPLDLVVVRIDLPDDAGLYDEPRVEDLPKGWSDLPSSPIAAAFGDAFLAKGNCLGLMVPSAIIPEASNILINPGHPRMSGVTMEILREFTFEPRLRR